LASKRTDRVSRWASRTLPRALRRLGLAPVPERPADSKIFCIGFNKTGTSSLHSLFLRAGLRSHHSPSWRDMNEQLVSRFDSFTDGRPDDLGELCRRYPRSQFILNVRDLDGWLASRLDHVRRDKDSGSWKTQNDHWDDTDRVLESWVTLRNSYHCSVLDHFRNSPEKALIINLCRDREAAKKVHAFLGLGSPPASTPHENSSPRGDTRIHHRERLRGLLDQLEIPTAERTNDILCPSLLPVEQRTRYPADTSTLSGHSWAKGAGGAAARPDDGSGERAAVQ